jgi:hypothetical protein
MSSCAAAPEAASTPPSSVVTPSASPVAREEEESLSQEGYYTIERPSRETVTPMGEEGTWSIFIYMCGADLESQVGMASFNLSQIMNAVPAENVNIIVQTGGSEQWGNPSRGDAADLALLGVDDWGARGVDATKLQRYKVTDTMTLVDEQPLASMGSQQTFYEFLSWGVENYPAEKMGVILWNHGGGSLSGVCFDDLFEGDSLFLFEMDNALNKLYDEMTDQFEFIGFDACLMSTIETANVLVPHARYMYASQEVEGGYGWDYSSLISELNRGPDTGEALGKALCDSYFSFYRSIDYHKIATLSVTDLSRIDDVLYALNAFGQALLPAFDDPAMLGVISRGADRAQNYRNKSMLDLSDFAGILKVITPEESEAVIAAVDEAVLYSVEGPGSLYSNGLSVYYPTDVIASTIVRYTLNFAPPAYFDYINRLHYAKLKLTISGEQLIEVVQEPYVDDDGDYVMQINPASLNYVRDAAFQVFIEAGEDAYLLGYNNDMQIDLETGELKDTWEGAWAQIDGQPLMIQLTDYKEGEYEMYSSPVSLNGQNTNLLLCWVVDEGEESGGYFEILGTASGADPYTGRASRVTRALEPGDTITPMYYALPYDLVVSEEPAEPNEYLDEDGEYILAEGEPILIREDTEVEYEMIAPANYLFQFRLFDVYGTEVTYAPITFEVDEEGDIFAIGEEES